MSYVRLWCRGEGMNRNKDTTLPNRRGMTDSRYGSTVLVPKRYVTPLGEFEISLHCCGKPFVREVEMVLPNMDLTNLLCIPTMQHAQHDLVKIGNEIELEKDRLLENFMEFAKELCNLLSKDGHFADYIDPCSGLAMITRETNKVYSEVDGAQQLLGYAVQNAGCCKVLLHPAWNSSVYPASIFTTAPADKITPELFEKAIAKMRKV